MPLKLRRRTLLQAFGGVPVAMAWPLRTAPIEALPIPAEANQPMAGSAARFSQSPIPGWDLIAALARKNEIRPASPNFIMTMLHSKVMTRRPVVFEDERLGLSAEFSQGDTPASLCLAVTLAGFAIGHARTMGLQAVAVSPGTYKANVFRDGRVLFGDAWTRTAFDCAAGLLGGVHPVSPKVASTASKAQQMPSTAEATALDFLWRFAGGVSRITSFVRAGAQVVKAVLRSRVVVLEAISAAEAPLQIAAEHSIDMTPELMAALQPIRDPGGPFM